jgi:putative ATP-grasp target RiPP
MFAHSTRMPGGTQYPDIQTTPVPFVVSQLAPFPRTNIVPAPARTELDPETQLAISYDVAGAAIEMGEHGTSTNSETSTSTSSDGANGNVDSDKDQNGDQ